ncbi:MAG: hypothetical protein Kapaf2KO_11770 [Candidatus Kapaibacteriales bacterium]
MKNLFITIVTILLSCASLIAAEKEVVIKTSAECEECKIAIEEAVNELPGIAKADLNIPTKELTVVFDDEDIELEIIRKAINKAGYDADDTKATKRGLANLPDCCKPGGMERK